ncbi:hypothetical protein EVAR_81773_1 [Eumeta japonica]|uniref:Uncharacterized protein n=1 Tax=Eumeta variegata TaxID=151549 RepID=A0A4C1UIB0_EUMVA|nr:hypothetical protein EVAR_81773_1 [Eumeta japonica]
MECKRNAGRRKKKVGERNTCALYRSQAIQSVRVSCAVLNVDFRLQNGYENNQPTVHENFKPKRKKQSGRNKGVSIDNSQDGRVYGRVDPDVIVASTLRRRFARRPSLSLCARVVTSKRHRLHGVTSRCTLRNIK